MQVKIISK